MTIPQVIQVAYNAGFRGQGLITAVAIAYAESGLNPIAVNYNKDASGNVTSVDRGLWQINSYWHPQYTAPDIFNSQSNANAAYAISKQGTNFKPWVTYNKNLHSKYIAQVAALIDKVEETVKDNVLPLAIAAVTLYLIFS